MADLEDGVELIRESSLSDLRDRRYLERLIVECGLVTSMMLDNDKYPYPGEYEAYRSKDGFRICQHPCQLAPYLIWLSDKHIKRYMEIGVWMGGTFIFTTEYLNRFTEMECAESVDIDYKLTNIVHRWCPPANIKKVITNMDIRTSSFGAYLCSRQFDFVLIDADHSEHGVRSDFDKVQKSGVPYIAFHDICDSWNLGVGVTWNNLQQEYPLYRFHEFTEQYPRNDTMTRFGLGIIEVR